jgi:hypothetical protein
MKKLSVMVASMFAAVSLATFAVEPQTGAGEQAKSDAKTEVKAPVQMSETEMDKVVAGKSGFGGFKCEGGLLDIGIGVGGKDAEKSFINELSGGDNC